MESEWGAKAAKQTDCPWCPEDSQVTRMISWEVAAGVCTCVMGQMSMAGGSWLLADVLVLSLTALSALPDSRQSAGSNSLASLGLLPASSAVHLQ